MDLRMTGVVASTTPNSSSYCFKFVVRASMVLFKLPGLTMIRETRWAPFGEFKSQSIINSSGL